MHWKMCKEFGIEVKKRWYENEPKTVTEKNSVTILWDMPIHNDRTITANRPGIVLNKRRTKPVFSLTRLYPSTLTPQSKPRERLPNTKTWKSRLSEFWGLKTTTVPVVMGALGTIKNETENYSNKIPGNTFDIHELQKLAVVALGLKTSVYNSVFQ